MNMSLKLKPSNFEPRLWNECVRSWQWPRADIISHSFNKSCRSAGAPPVGSLSWLTMHLPLDHIWLGSVWWPQEPVRCPPWIVLHGSAKAASGVCVMTPLLTVVQTSWPVLHANQHSKPIAIHHHICLDAHINSTTITSQIVMVQCSHVWVQH